MTLRPVLACGAVLVPLWGYLLPGYLLLDPLALGPARAAGLVGAVAALLATSGAYALRRRLGGPPGPHRSAWDLAMLSSLAALTVWTQGSVGGRLPYLEGFALALLDLAAGWAAALAAYVLIARRRRRDSASGRGLSGVSDPPMRSVFIYTALGLALIAAVVLGVGSVGRAAGARARQVAEHAVALADLAAAALKRVPPDETARRTQIVDALTTHGEVVATLEPPGQRPAAFMQGEATARTDDGYLVQVPNGRMHFVTRPLPDGTALWVRSDLRSSAVLLATDDAPGLLILALLALTAPLATGIVGRELSADLRELTTALARAGEPGRPVADVPVRSHDEVGDLARTLNETLRAREAEITRLARELEGADASDRARSRFLAGASHELRTPLNAIVGYCHLLKRTPLNEAQAEDVALIEEAGLQLLGHVDEILDLSRIEAGEDAPLERRPTDLGALIRQVCQSRAADVPAGISLEVGPLAALPRLSVDPLRVRQVLENLVGNALKFTRAGRVQVLAGPADGGVHVQVVDTGPGIPAAELESIFEEFHRVEGQRQVVGTGLGLAIARRLVQQHGGRLYAESVLGQGATFHLVLPADPAPESPEGST